MGPCTLSEITDVAPLPLQKLIFFVFFLPLKITMRTTSGRRIVGCWCHSSPSCSICLQPSALQHFLPLSHPPLEEFAFTLALLWCANVKNCLYGTSTFPSHYFYVCIKCALSLCSFILPMHNISILKLWHPLNNLVAHFEPFPENL